MAKLKTLDHPEGTQNCVVTDLRRGRWRCRDYVEKDREKEQSESGSAPQSQQNIPPLQNAGTSANCQDDQAVSLVSAVDDKKRGEDDGEEGLDIQHYSSDLPTVTLDSNFNALLRCPRSRTTRTKETTGTTKEEEDEGRWFSRGEVTVTVVMVCAVLSPYLAPGWSAVSDGLRLLLTAWGAALHGPALLFITGILLLLLQVNFYSYWVRQWVARVFRLQLMEDQGTPSDQALCAPCPVSRRQAQPAGGEKAARVAASIAPAMTTGQRCGCQSNATPYCRCQQTVDANSTERVDGELPETSRCSQNPPSTVHSLNTQSTGKRYKHALKNMYRKFLRIRRKYRAEISGLRRTDQEAGQMLCRIQLSLPVLQKEKQALLAELEAIQKQHQEERRRNHDLLLRLQRLNQQFHSIGTCQAGPPARAPDGHHADIQHLPPTQTPPSPPTSTAQQQLQIRPRDHIKDSSTTDSVHTTRHSLH